MVRSIPHPLGLRLEFSERRFFLRLGDLTLTLIGTLGALWLWAQLAARPFDWPLLREQLPWMLTIGAAWLVWLVTMDMYDLRRAVHVRSCLWRLSLGAFTIGVLYAIYFFVTAVPPTVFRGYGAAAPEATPLRLAPGLAIVATAGLLALWRSAYALVLGAPHARRRVLILGAGAAGTILAEELSKNEHFELLGFVDDDPHKCGLRICDVPVMGGHERMIEVVEATVVDEIVLAISAQMTGGLFQAVMDCHERGLTITPMPLLYEQLTGKIPVEHIGSQWYVALPFETHPFMTVNGLAKRLLDLAFGVLGGAVFLLLLPVVAVVIRLDSRGPIFYRQERMGRHGTVFTVIKFRSMVKDAERDGTAQWATKDDGRITRVGRFLRKTRLDELPQILNVLRGEMSMVGPRPERPQFIEKLQQQIPFYRTRLAAKPGLTGWAQVNYGYGASVNDALIKLQYDLFYLKHQSIWFDLKILLRTVAVVLKMKGQ